MSKIETSCIKVSDGLFCQYCKSKNIIKNGKELSRLVDDILDLSKIEAGKIKVEKKRTDIFELLGEIKSITSSIISELISLSPDAFSLELTNEESIFYTFKKDDYSFYIQQYFETEDDGFNATLVSFKGDNKIDSINGNINSIIESIESKISAYTSSASWGEI